MTRRGKHGTGPVALQPAPGGAYNPPGRRLQPWLHPFIRREDLPCQAARRHGACRPAHPRFRAMILTCPACSTRYTLDPQSLAMAHISAVLDDYHHACHDQDRS